jgi:prolyl-tRNA editing enzyme YbaK/EbsC (Cys-tRNA(Pro) deacylase)
MLRGLFGALLVGDTIAFRELWLSSERPYTAYLESHPMAELSASAQKVQQTLAAKGLDCKVLEMPDTTRTAQEAAAAIGCSVKQIAKSLIFKTRRTNQPILVIASGSNRVSEKRLAELLNEPLDKADADYVRERTGFAIGGVPPVGHTQQLRTLIDQDLVALDEIWAAAGTPHAVFALTPAALVRITGGECILVK